MRKNTVLSMVLPALLFIPATVCGQQPPAKVVQVADVIMTEIAPNVSVPGTVHSRNDVQITAGVAGQLEMVLEPGTVVQKGEVVARIDRTALMLQRAEQEALLARAEITVRQLNSDLRRQKELQSSNLVSEFELEQTEANRDLAQSDADITQVRIRQIDEQIRRAETVAKFTGIVTERLHREGEEVPRGEVLARITDIENMEVRAFVPLKHLQRIAVGNAIDVYESDTRQTGTIRALIPAADVRSQTFEAHIDLTDSALSHWAVGQLVSVAVPMQASAATLAVPRDALILRQSGAFVYRINEENVAERIPVQIGDSQGLLIAVTGALVEGDQVAVRGAESLSDGAIVEIMATTETASLVTATDRG